MRALLFIIFVVTGMSAVSPAIAATYDQTITPNQFCGRPFTCTFTFNDVLKPGSSGTLTVLGEGDINEPYEFAKVYDESDNFIDDAWDITCPGGLYGGCEYRLQDSMTIPLTSLLANWADGTLSYSFVVPPENGLSGVTFLSLRLTYEEATPNPVPTPGTFGLLSAGLAGLVFARRRGVRMR